MKKNIVTTEKMDFRGEGRRDFIRKGMLALGSMSLVKSHILAGLTGKSGLKDYFRNDFYVGTAINTNTFTKPDEEMLGLIQREFNAITTANALKWGPVHPSEGIWNFDVTDKFVEFGNRNKMFVQGHVLVWHSQVPSGLFEDSSGNPLSREALLKKMENHILTLVDRYKGGIHSWDVVNEAITPEEGFRKSKWYEIIGPEYIERAFHLAHEADPGCHLIYNDYGMNNPKRRDFVVELVKQYKKKGVPIHGIGMQGPYHLNSPDISEIEASINAFAAVGMRVHITELDVDVLPSAGVGGANISDRAEYRKSLNPYTEGLPKEVSDKLSQRYEELFRLFLKHRDKIERVTFWGASDDESWKNNFPVRGRTNYPLLFDRQRKPNDAWFAVTSIKD